jgi:hypothetical protein
LSILFNLRLAIAQRESVRLGQEAHALKVATLTIGARGMADICKQLENLGTAQSLEVSHKSSHGWKANSPE